MRERLSPRSSLNRRSSMAVSPESARVLNPQSQVNVTGIDPLPGRKIRFATSPQRITFRFGVKDATGPRKGLRPTLS